MYTTSCNEARTNYVNFPKLEKMFDLAEKKSSLSFVDFSVLQCTSIFLFKNDIAHTFHHLDLHKREVRALHIDQGCHIHEIKNKTYSEK